jgi:hypothetical protein
VVVILILYLSSKAAGVVILSAEGAKDLLDYCERDTWAMVKVLELRELARPPTAR